MPFPLIAAIGSIGTAVQSVQTGASLIKGLFGGGEEQREVAIGPSGQEVFGEVGSAISTGIQGLFQRLGVGQFAPRFQEREVSPRLRPMSSFEEFESGFERFGSQFAEQMRFPQQAFGRFYRPDTLEFLEEFGEDYF